MHKLATFTKTIVITNLQEVLSDLYLLVFLPLVCTFPH